MELRVDPMRDFSYDIRNEYQASGIHVRALRNDKWSSADIFELDLDSLREWVRSRGEVSDWAMGVIEHLLLHPRNDRCGVVNPRTGWVCTDAPHGGLTHHTLRDNEIYDWQVEV